MPDREGIETSEMGQTCQSAAATANGVPQYEGIEPRRVQETNLRSGRAVRPRDACPGTVTRRYATRRMRWLHGSATYMLTTRATIVSIRIDLPLMVAPPILDWDCFFPAAPVAHGRRLAGTFPSGAQPVLRRAFAHI
jgi:hypothetical protein